jgi:hypothetical protein
MDLMSSAQLSITDVIVVSHPVIQDAVEASAKRTLSPEQDYAVQRLLWQKQSGEDERARWRAPGHACTCVLLFLPFSDSCQQVGVEICILINGKACMKMRLKANGQADFANNTSHPDPGVLESLPLRPGKNHLEARILHSLYAFNSFLGAEGAIWWWPCEARVCVVDIDGTVTISDKRGTCYIVCAIWAIMGTV